VEHELETGSDGHLDYVRSIFSRRVPLAAQLTDLAWISDYQLQPALTSSYRNGRVFIAGDAAHTFYPAGAPGFNAGLQDAFNLGWKIAFARHVEGAEIILKSYEIERRHFAQALTSLYSSLLAELRLRSPSSLHVRQFGLSLIAGWNPSDTHGESSLNYRDSPIVERNGHFGRTALHPGDRMPIPGNTAKLLSNDTGEPCHTLLLFSAGDNSFEHISFLSAIRRDFEAAYPELVRGFVITTNHERGRDIWNDDQRHLHSAFAADLPCLYLIRPDGYIAYQSQPPDGAALHRFFRSVYGLLPMYRRSHASGEA
jgi:hypothetical protein